LGTPLSRGFSAQAVANPGVVFYANEPSTVTVDSAYVDEGVSTIRYTVGTGAVYNDMQFYLENENAVTGTRYSLTFTLNAGVAFSGIVNGETIDFVRGDNAVTSHFEETDEASLHIIAATSETTLVSNTIALSGFTFTEKVYDPIEDVVIDGSLEDWIDVRAYERPIGVTGVTPDTDHKSVTFYAALGNDGLYLFAHAFHDIYTTTAGEWWQNTNFEFFIKGGNQYWVSAGPSFTHSKVTSAIVSSEYSGEANYETKIEAFVANADLPEGAIVAGQVRVGFAWKTIGDQNTGGEAAGGGYDDYWVPAGTWVNNADQTFVTNHGIFLDDQVNIPPTTLDVDGDISDWATYAAYTTNYAELIGTDTTSHKSVRFFAMVASDGLYLAALAYHDGYINDAGLWWQNTNFEVFVNGGTQYYVAANGAVATGTGAMHTEAYEGTANYVTVAELFIPAPYFAAADYQRVGFAWKTPGDDITGGAANGGNADSYWVIPGHWPNNAAEQFYVNADGIFASIG